MERGGGTLGEVQRLGARLIREDGAVQINEGAVEVFASSALMVEVLAGLECIELGLL